MGAPAELRFADFEVSLRSGELRRNGIKVKLQEQPFQILVLLLERRGEIVSREDICQKLWTADTFVDFDNGLNIAVKKLRIALGDDADAPAYIETLPRRGYRFLAPVTRTQEPPAEAKGLVGKKVSHYRVLEVIGGGGMGLVYKAEDLKLGRRVALKFLPEELATDSIALQRFDREARTASSLNHPHICTIYEVEEYEGQPFIVMELLEGETLRDRLAASQGTLALEQMLDIALQVTDGLEVAHEQGIIHRDIKPANIFITSKGVCKILDFGIAKLLVEAPESARVERGFSPASQPPSSFPSGLLPGQGLRAAHDNRKDSLERGPESPLYSPATPAHATLTVTGSAMGTAGYMSPEQVRGEKLDARTDIFSFGLVLYEMATGQRAFTGETAAVVHEAIVKDKPVPVRELNATLPAKLLSVIDKALEKDRERRYQSAAEMRGDLLQIEPTVRQPLANRRWKLLAALAIVLVAVTVASRYWLRSGEGGKLSANDTVVLADFINNTSDSVFDTALKTALEIGLGQTPFLNVLSAEKVRGTLKLMGHPEDDRLTTQLARDVCERTNSKAVLQGSISDEGNKYRLEIKAFDCKTGNMLADSTTTAADRNEIVKRLGAAGISLREKLGEPASSVRRFNAPLDKAASASPEALQAWAAGMAIFGKLEALSYFKRATDLDPNFALAFLALGFSYSNDYRGDLAFQNFAEAYRLRERLSDRDRVDTEFAYYSGGTGEFDKAILTAEQGIQDFPQWGRLRNNFGGLWRRVGQYEKSVAEEREAVRLVPDNLAPYVNLSWSYTALDRLEEAKVVLEQEKDRTPDAWYLHWSLYRLAFLQHGQNGMQQQVRWAADNPGVQDFILMEQSGTQAYYGRLRKADEISQHAAASAAQAGAPQRGAEWKATEALRAAKVGETTRALKLAQEAVSLNPREEARGIAALAFAKAGDASRALQQVEELNHRFPMHSLIQGYYLPTIRAEIEIQRSNPASAIVMLDRAAPYELMFSDQFGLESAYVRGEAYLQAGQGQKAAAEFRKVLEHPGIVVNSINGALAHLQLARAQAMMGDKEAAHGSYEDFLTLWKDADPDIPIYRQAKAEYAKLK